MSENTPSILIDTNIWLDYYLANRKTHHEALTLIGYIKDNNLTLLYTATSIKDVFYLVNQEVKHMARETKGTLMDSDALACRAIAWGCIRNMEELASAVPVGEPQVWLASHFQDIHDDFEDDLTFAALETAKVDFLVTNDEALRKKSPLAAFDAKDMLTYLSTRKIAGL